MSFTVENLNLGSFDSEKIISETISTSGFAKLSAAVAVLPAHGTSITVTGGYKATGIGEGGQKVASGTNSSVKMGANKLQVSAVVTEEFLATKAAVANTVLKQFPSVTARDYDRIVLGLDPVPADWDNFSTAASLETVEVIAGGESNLDDATDEVANGNITGILLTSKMLSYLRRQRNTLGTRVYDITDETIDGVPYAKVNGSEAVGIIGDFSQAYGAIQEFKNVTDGTSYRIKDAGTITDMSGVEHNLTDSNKYAFIYEQIVGSAFTADNLVRIVPATATGE